MIHTYLKSNTFTKLEGNLEKIRNEITAGKDYIAKFDKKKSIRRENSKN